MQDDIRLTLDEAQHICEQAALRLGASPATALSLARSAVAAEADGQPNVGVAHFIDYLDAIAAGRIDGRVEPTVTRPAPTMIASDAHGGAAHPGFDQALGLLLEAARNYGMALFSQKNSYTCGALGYFTGRLAEAGLMGLAATNGPALVVGSGGTKPVYCTNPLAFSAPSADGNHLTIDQASSATAFVNIRKAAKDGRAIPEGWALDSDGNPTTDAAKAVKGALLAFGGARGANIALMVEIMSAALTGANWSVDAPWFADGAQSPGTGMTVIAVRPDLLAPDFGERLAAHLRRLSGEFGVHLPGAAKLASRRQAEAEGIAIPRDVHDRILNYR
jgi:(2R)-3-sulfolactate dehydrogenase (NADP+)